MIKKKKKLNIVIPMAWAWIRFVEQWYKLPKPLIKIRWKKMFEWAVSSFDFLKDYYDITFIFIVLKEHVNKFNIYEEIKSKYIKSHVIILNKITSWQAETVLMAKKFIDKNKLIIYNSDTYSDYNIKDFLIHNEDIDWFITCFKSSNKAYSYAEIDDIWNVIKVAEKQLISKNATNWLYYYKNWTEFLCSIEEMIKNKDYVNWEFYVWPVYNYLINKWKIIKVCPIKKNWILWTPTELNYFLLNYK